MKMFAGVLSCIFLAALAVHLAGVILGVWAPVDRWLRSHAWRGWPLRSLCPNWGLFAQRYGMFDLDVWGRVVHDSGGSAQWIRYTDPARSWHAALVRPRYRSDAMGRALALGLIGDGALNGGPEIAHTLAYRRILNYGRNRNRDIAADGTHLQFSLRVARGWWSLAEPTTIYLSPLEPAAGASGGPRQAPA